MYVFYLYKSFNSKNYFFVAPPVILRSLTDQLIAINESVTFQCQLFRDWSGGGSGSGGGGTTGSNGANGKTTIEWFHDGFPIVPVLMPRDDRRRYRLSNYELQIRRVQLSDNGVYQCIVTNEVGSASSSALLNVKNFAPIFHSNVFPAKVYLTEGVKMVSKVLSIA